jgi:D-serine deaminase-like pyridoxal phosphate-dependent protein
VTAILIARVEQRSTQMLAYVEHHNLTARPFTWTHTGKTLAG